MSETPKFLLADVIILDDGAIGVISHRGADRYNDIIS